jgi:UDP-N-acetylglucosamine 1-carboxyvinyltransferase
MDKLVVRGGKKLSGNIQASGAKNSALVLMFASLLADGRYVLTNVPKLKDVESARDLLKALGASSDYNSEKNELTIETKSSTSHEAMYDLVRKMRASILCLGPLLTRYGEATVSLPGGCAIGTRPIDMHLEGLKAMGAEIKIENGYVHAKAQKLKGAVISFDSPTVGGTENIMMAATMAHGITTLENAAMEPEIVDLAQLLNKMGAKISGFGTKVIRIEGVNRLQAANHHVIPDRIEVGTYLMAAAITGGEICVEKTIPQHLDHLLTTLEECGSEIHCVADKIHLRQLRALKTKDITTNPYPDFPTDLQAQFMALMTQAEGTSVITESVFENRFMHVPELCRLGADINPKTKVAIVHGKPGRLIGAPVMATDLRASASLILAGLVASGETVINRIYHLDRGYEKLEEKLKSLGAEVFRQ